jgi:hypothetical protein
MGEFDCGAGHPAVVKMKRTPSGLPSTKLRASRPPRP